MAEKPDDMLGKVVVVTGASTGIGREIARGLALKRATVIVAARSEERGRAAAEEVSDDAANPAVEFMQVDVSSARSVRAFAEAFAKKHAKLDVLVNNAGVWSPERRENDAGIELTWATNVLGYFLVTRSLEAPLKAAAPSRVVNVASNFARGLDLDDVEYKKRSYSGSGAYAASKQADRALTWAFADRWRSAGVTANALHPGVVSTELGRDSNFAARLYFKLFGISAERGADTAVWLASSGALKSDTSGYYVKRKETRCPFRDEAKTEKLWDICERMVS
jgi:retinol dehydrogenase-12/retinol dehydrogenase-13